MSALDLTFAAQSETVIDGLQDVMHLVLRRLNIDVASFVCLIVMMLIVTTHLLHPFLEEENTRN